MFIYAVIVTRTLFAVKSVSNTFQDTISFSKDHTYLLKALPEIDMKDLKCRSC